MDNIIIFGAGNTGIRAFETNCNKCNILCFLDNDKTKWGKELKGVPILEPVIENITKFSYDYILIASVFGKLNIENQLIGMGIPDNKIKFLQSTYDVLSPFLLNLSKLYSLKKVDGSVAEVGVFRGESAEKINRYFSDRILHLFDTFTGFPEKDIEIENLKGFSEAKSNQYDDTTVELVLNRMEKPQNVVIHKGYFPETAVDIKEDFCFVRIDLDLYLPTVAALNFFHPLMVHGGCILVHDYFGESYKGIKQAISEYMDIHQELALLPIGDNLSIAIVGY